VSSRGGIRWTQGDPAAAARALRDAQDGVREALADTVRAVPDALERAFVDEAGTLPRRGGLSRLVASSDLAVDEDLAGDTVGVTVRAGNARVDLGPLNRGDLRHPVYRTGRWVSQPVRSGFWQRACETAAEGSDDELLQRIRDVAQDTARRASSS